jgi:hypothetical protein
MESPSQEQEIRVQFLLFVKIIFRCLDKSGDELLREQAKLVVLNCGERGTTLSMRESIEVQLKDVVGDSIWDQAKDYTAFYLKRRGLLQHQQRIRKFLADMQRHNELHGSLKRWDFEPTPIRAPPRSITARKA